jgi:mannose-1-phosphate guanylyltransferase
VLAGGSGRRLAALTERLTGRPTPKQFCAFGGRRTLIQQTLARLSALVPAHRTAVVVRDVDRDLAREQIHGFPGAVLLSQPSDCGTAPALLWALVHVLGRAPDADVVVTPSDHGVLDKGAYLRGIVAAREAVEGTPAVLLGVEADAPRTDYGWIVPGPELAPGVRRVLVFVEKPGYADASALRARGALFSTMVLVARARALLGLFERARPGLAALLLPLATLPPPARALHLRRAYALLPPCDFSRDILEASRNLAVVRWPRNVGWTDLGTPERVAEWLAGEAAVPEAVG